MKKRGEKSTSNKSKKDFLWWALRVSFVVMFFPLIYLIVYLFDPSCLDYSDTIFIIIFFVSTASTLVFSIISRIKHKSQKEIFSILALIISIFLLFFGFIFTFLVYNDILYRCYGPAPGSYDWVMRQCKYTQIQATNVDCSNPSACSLILERTGSITDELGGVKLVFKSETDTSEIIDVFEHIEPSSSKVITVDSGLTSPNRVEVTPYFLDDSGEKVLCQQKSVFDF